MVWFWNRYPDGDSNPSSVLVMMVAIFSAIAGGLAMCFNLMPLLGQENVLPILGNVLIPILILTFEILAVLYFIFERAIRSASPKRIRYAAESSASDAFMLQFLNNSMIAWTLMLVTYGSLWLRAGVDGHSQTGPISLPTVGASVSDLYVYHQEDRLWMAAQLIALFAGAYNVIAWFDYTSLCRANFSTISYSSNDGQSLMAAPKGGRKERHSQMINPDSVPFDPFTTPYRRKQRGGEVEGVFSMQ